MKIRSLFAMFATGILLAACTSEETEMPVTDSTQSVRPDIIATNAFYYYADVDAVWSFYRDTLGLETVVDYGFAKIVRLADTSYLTLVQASEGMHSIDEPKTVTLNLVTDELNNWYQYLVSNDVPMRVDLAEVDGAEPDSFVAIDPEGYFLKFVRYDPQPNSESFVAAFADVAPVISGVDATMGQLSIRATAFSAYFENLDSTRPFYESLFDITPSGQINGADAYQFSSSGFLALVDGADDLHSPTEKNAVTLSFLTSDIDGWFDRSTSWPGFELRTPEIIEEGGGLVRVFVGYDPEGIFLEWDTFQDGPGNEEMIKYLP